VQLWLEIDQPDRDADEQVQHIAEHFMQILSHGSVR
jgi:hypothetical protein